MHTTFKTKRAHMQGMVFSFVFFFYSAVASNSMQLLKSMRNTRSCFGTSIRAKVVILEHLMLCDDAFTVIILINLPHFRN